jgi:lipopolysaccharide transport system permease protein
MSIGEYVEIYLGETEKKSLLVVYKDIFKGFKTSIGIGYNLFLKDLRADYVKTKFGLVWDIVEPIVFAIVFIFLKKSQVVGVGNIVIPYAVFVIIGMLLWQIFVDSLLLPFRIINSTKNILTHVKICPEALFYAVFFKVYFYGVIRFLVIVSFCIFYNTLSVFGMLKFLLIFSVLPLVGFSIGFLLSPLNIIYGDVTKLINVILRPLMFISGVVFAIPKNGLLSTVSFFNPISIVIENLRTVLTSNIIVNPQYFISTFFGYLILFFIAWSIFHLSIQFISERL